MWNAIFMVVSLVLAFRLVYRINPRTFRVLPGDTPFTVKADGELRDIAWWTRNRNGGSLQLKRQRDEENMVAVHWGGRDLRLRLDWDCDFHEIWVDHDAPVSVWPSMWCDSIGDEGVPNLCFKESPRNDTVAMGKFCLGVGSAQWRQYPFMQLDGTRLSFNPRAPLVSVCEGEESVGCVFASGGLCKFEDGSRFPGKLRLADYYVEYDIMQGQLTACYVEWSGLSMLFGFFALFAGVNEILRRGDHAVFGIPQGRIPSRGLHYIIIDFMLLTIGWFVGEAPAVLPFWLSGLLIFRLATFGDGGPVSTAARIALAHLPVDSVMEPLAGGTFSLLWGMAIATSLLALSIASTIRAPVKSTTWIVETAVVYLFTVHCSVMVWVRMLAHDEVWNLPTSSTVSGLFVVIIIVAGALGRVSNVRLGMHEKLT